jgi:hypothetical protein
MHDVHTAALNTLAGERNVQVNFRDRQLSYPIYHYDRAYPLPFLLTTV